MLNTIVKSVPTIHIDQLFPQSGKWARRGSHGVDVDDSDIWGISGARGSGKSETLSYMGMRAMAMDLPAWLNYPIKFNLISHDDSMKTLESRPLLFKDIFALSDEFRGGFIGVDEYQDWANAYSFMSTQNKLLNGWWAQIRKNDLSFGYVAKKLRWVDLKTREETDIEMACQDAAKTRSGFSRYQRGEMIYWHIRDLSGNWTGRMYEDYPIEHELKFCAKFIWGAYDTKQRFDIFEAMRGIKLDLEKSVISDKEQQFNIELEEERCKALFKESPRWKTSEFFGTLGVENNVQKARISKLLKDIGVIDKVTGGYRYFIFTGSYKDDEAL